MVKQLNMGVLGAVALLTPFSALATTFNCGSSHPTCAQLGFRQTANECKGYKAIKCPFDQNALFCGDSTNVPENMSYNESMTCGTRDCDALGYNRTAEECERTHTRLACPFDETKFYCGGYNCVAGDTLYTDANNNIGCWKGSDANGKTPIGFMLNDKVAIDLSFYGSAYSGENYVRNIGGHSGQIVWRNKGKQESIECERGVSSATGLFSSGSNVPCNGAPFANIEVPYDNIFNIADYSNTFDNSGVAAMGGYYTTTTDNNGYYITNLLAQSGGFNVNADRFVPVCKVTAVSNLLTPNTPCLAADSGATKITDAAVLNLKKDVVRQIQILRELKKSVGTVKVGDSESSMDTIQTSTNWLPYMTSYPATLTTATSAISGSGSTARQTLINICKDLRRGNCATSIINAQSSFNTIDIAKPSGATGFSVLHRNRALRPYHSNIVEFLPTEKPWEEVKSTTSYFCSCAMKQVPQFPMLRAKEVTGGFFNPRMASISAAGEVSFAATPAASLKRVVGVGSSAARLCADRTAGGQDWFLPAPGDIKNLMEDPEMLEKYRQALLAAASQTSVFPSGFNGQNLAKVKSPEVLMKRELGRTITSAMYLSNSSGNTSGIMCPLEQSSVSSRAKRDVGSTIYQWDLQLSLLGDVTHCVTLVGVDASQYETTARIGKKHLCTDPILPAKVKNDDVINSIVDSRRNIVKGADITDDISANVSDITKSSYSDKFDAKGL